MLLIGKRLTSELSFGHSKHAKSFGSHSSDSLVEQSCVLFRKMAKVRNCLRRSLCCDDKLGAIRRSPHFRYREEALRERVLSNDRPISVQVLRALQCSASSPRLRIARSIGSKG